MPAPASAFGEPLAGLSTAQLQSFADGLEEFTNVDTPDSGLGPIFNNVSCRTSTSAGAPALSEAWYLPISATWRNFDFIGKLHH